MLKYYIVLVSTNINLEELCDFFDKDPKVDNWFTTFPSACFIRTKMGSKEISLSVAKRFGMHPNFVQEITTSAFGRLPEEHWIFLGRKVDRRSPSENEEESMKSKNKEITK